VRKYIPASLAPAVYVAEVAPAMSEQFDALESEQRCHLYVFAIATGCKLNVKADVKTCPEPVLPVGALAAKTVGVKEVLPLIEPQELFLAAELTPSLFRARIYGAKLDEYQEVTE
jgi:hypothetical protein